MKSPFVNCSNPTSKCLSESPPAAASQSPASALIGLRGQAKLSAHVAWPGPSLRRLKSPQKKTFNEAQADVNLQTVHCHALPTSQSSRRNRHNRDSICEIKLSSSKEFTVDHTKRLRLNQGRSLNCAWYLKSSLTWRQCDAVLVVTLQLLYPS